MKAYLRLLGTPFLRFWLGQSAYAAGNNIAIVLLTLTVYYRYNGSPVAISFLFFLRLFPVALVGFVSGPIVARLGALRCTRLCLAVFAGCILGWNIAGPGIYMWALVVLYHAVYGVFKAARATALAWLVSEQEDRVLATGLLFGGRDLVAIVSGVLAAWLYAAGHSWIAAVTAALMMMLGVFLGLQGKEEPAAGGTIAAELAEGWRYVLHEPAVRWFTVALFPIWAGMGGIMSTLVFLIISWWHGNAVVYGWGTSLLAAGGALGMFIGPLFTGKWPLSGLVRGFRFTLGIPALLFICFGGAPAWLPGLALLFVASTAFGANNSMEKVLEQCLPVERWRAQAISAMSAIGTLGYIMGTVGAPLLLRFINPPTVTVLCAVLIGVGAAFPLRAVTGMTMGEEPLAGCPTSETGLE